jgi:hypothetical protein
MDESTEKVQSAASSVSGHHSTGSFSMWLPLSKSLNSSKVENADDYDKEFEFSCTVPHKECYIEGTWDELRYLLDILLITYGAHVEATGSNDRQQNSTMSQ